MEISEFDKTQWHFGMRVRYEGEVRKLYGVNFPERIVGMCDLSDKNSDDPYWARCENVSVVPQLSGDDTKQER